VRHGQVPAAEFERLNDLGGGSDSGIYPGYWQGPRRSKAGRGVFARSGIEGDNEIAAFEQERTRTHRVDHNVVVPGPVSHLIQGVWSAKAVFGPPFCLPGYTPGYTGRAISVHWQIHPKLKMPRRLGPWHHQRGIGMNMRRGLFRLWVVISALWIVFGGYLSYRDLQKVSAPIQLVSPTGDKIEIPGNTSKDAARRAVADYIQEKIKQNFFNKFDLGKPDDILKVYEPRSYWAVIWTSLGTMFLPPLILLTLGLAAIWTIDGFKKQ
jgi:hypothetical protein